MSFKIWKLRLVILLKKPIYSGNLHHLPIRMSKEVVAIVGDLN